ncbi:hypothetical protein M513_03852 [Trichuris suis]|uniref:Uncharacterized protein n=1 Tax=Trichuris suis TaxID=68888 RepID=A0A085MDB5_9BILA|nr:hypothetical protein M513_03852 [Trichuris suis]
MRQERLTQQLHRPTVALLRRRTQRSTTTPCPGQPLLRFIAKVSEEKEKKKKQQSIAYGSRPRRSVILHGRSAPSTERLT